MVTEVITDICGNQFQLEVHLSKLDDDATAYDNTQVINSAVPIQDMNTINIGMMIIRLADDSALRMRSLSFMLSDDVNDTMQDVQWTVTNNTTGETQTYGPAGDSTGFYLETLATDFPSGFQVGHSVSVTLSITSANGVSNTDATTYTLV